MKVFERRCPSCNGDLLFALRLDGPSLRCLHCSRDIDSEQARLLLQNSVDRVAA